MSVSYFGAGNGKGVQSLVYNYNAHFRRFPRMKLKGSEFFETLASYTKGIWPYFSVEQSSQWYVSEVWDLCERKI